MPELRFRNSSQKQVVLGVADTVAERPGQRQQRRAHLCAPRKLPRCDPSEIVKHVGAEGSGDVFQPLRRMDHLLDRAGYGPRFPSVEKHGTYIPQSQKMTSYRNITGEQYE